MLKAYEAGHLSMQELAEKFGVSTSAINRWARDAGLPKRGRGPLPDPRSKRQKARAAALAEDTSPKILSPKEGSWIYRNGVARWVAVPTEKD